MVVDDGDDMVGMSSIIVSAAPSSSSRFLERVLMEGRYTGD
uniref:Uncharacterized protein n=1 Tax=Rhizophora mucronata TaxID=61149 RepID=A0A2P2IJQ1_RHIMU